MKTKELAAIVMFSMTLLSATVYAQMTNQTNSTFSARTTSYMLNSTTSTTVDIIAFNAINQTITNNSNTTANTNSLNLTISDTLSNQTHKQAIITNVAINNYTKAHQYNQTSDVTNSASSLNITMVLLPPAFV